MIKYRSYRIIIYSIHSSNENILPELHDHIISNRSTYPTIPIMIVPRVVREFEDVVGEEEAIID